MLKFWRDKQTICGDLFGTRSITDARADQLIEALQSCRPALCHTGPIFGSTRDCARLPHELCGVVAAILICVQVLVPIPS
jgi:hypothetical protein